MELKEQVSFAHPREFLNLSRIYCGDYYGSSLWRLREKEATKIFNTWDVKDMYNIPRQTHKYIAEGLGNMITVKMEIMARSRNLILNLRKSLCMETRSPVYFLMNDRRSFVGDNLAYIAEQCGRNPLVIGKEKMIELCHFQHSINP